MLISNKKNLFLQFGMTDPTNPNAHYRLGSQEYF